MADSQPNRRAWALEQLTPNTSHSFTTPIKRINDGEDLNYFLSSKAYRDLKLWMLQLNRSVFPAKRSDGRIDICTLDSPPPFSSSIQRLRALLLGFEELITQAPPDTGPRRFGNVAFRAWFRLAESNADGLLDRHVGHVLECHDLGQSHRKVEARDELKAYLLGGFGSAQRLDYGTGHELSFLAFLGGLWKMGAFAEGEERAIVMGVVEPYLDLIRKIIQTYTLEPAGSHGVWGLDDHSFIPYIFGSAQLGPPIDTTDPSLAARPTPTEGSLDEAPEPKSVTSAPTVREWQSKNMYFNAIAFIHAVKRGPFWEHSPILYDISGIKDGWGKINKGMLKMWDAEVLGKFPVVQHFAFGSLFPWERDPAAVNAEASMHSKQQPPTNTYGNGNATTASTAAPWSQPSGVSQMTGAMPSTKAPWAGNSVPARPVGTQQSGMAPTAAPWASGSSARMPQSPMSASNLPSTTAPWVGSAAASRLPPQSTRGGVPPRTDAPLRRKDG